MKHLFIVNPTAGGRDKTETVARRVEELFRNRSDKYEIYVTKAAMDAPEKIRRAARSGERLRIYACGGDGTFNECVCGAAGLENVAVCPYPTGTGNDFCRMFGPEQDLYRDLSALVEGWEHPIDLIECNGRYSANICSVGIDARIGTQVHNYSHIPLIGGATGYVVSTVMNVIKGINRNMRISSGAFKAQGKHALVCACNGRFYGGGFNPSLDARPDDGIMDVFVIKGVSLLTLVRLIGMYAKGRADEMPEYATHLRTDRIDISFDEDNVINIDGEAVFAREARLRLVPGAVRLVVPRGMTFFGPAPDSAG